MTPPATTWRRESWTGTTLNNYALDGIMGILQKYPSIQVVLDLHRDGVKESLHMVRTVNGKATAPIMFFNGMSQTPEGEIEYLKNPYKTENLAFSLRCSFWQKRNTRTHQKNFPKRTPL